MKRKSHLQVEKEKELPSLNYYFEDMFDIFYSMVIGLRMCTSKLPNKVPLLIITDYNSVQILKHLFFLMHDHMGKIENLSDCLFKCMFGSCRTSEKLVLDSKTVVKFPQGKHFVDFMFCVSRISYL